MTRPWLLLDVDGVLCLLGAGSREEHYEIQTGWQTVRIPERMPERLRRLSGVYRMAWATGWGEEANELLAECLGLPPLPVIDFPDEDIDPGTDYKLASIKRFVRNHPCVWVDDDIAITSQRWARDRGVPTLFVQTHPGRGLQDEHVDEMLDWAKALT